MSTPPPSPPPSTRHVHMGVSVNPTQISSIDSAASTTRTTHQSRPSFISESFLPRDLQGPSDVSTTTTTLTTTTVPPTHPPSSSSPSSPSHDAPSPSLQAATGTSRLPQSGLVLCGRKWLLGAEDMFIPACLSLVSDLFVLLLAIVALSFFPTDSSRLPSSCSLTSFTALQSTIILHVVLFFFLTVIDVGTMLSAWYADMFRRNRTVPAFLYARMLCSVLIIATSVTAAIYFFSITRNDCTRPYSRRLDLTCIALFTSSLVMCGFLFLYFACSYGAGQLCAPRAEDSWRDTLGGWFSDGKKKKEGGGGGGEGEKADHDVFSSVATIFSEFFSSSLPSSSIHVVPSDVAVALCLVQGMQRKRRREGEKFYLAAGKRRWDLAYIERYYQESLRKAEEEERKKKTETDGRSLEQQHAALKQALSSHQKKTDAPLPIKAGTTPDNPYPTKVDAEEKHDADDAASETVPASAPAFPTDADTNLPAVPVEVQRTAEEAYAHEEHLAAGPSFADRDEEEARATRRLSTPHLVVPPTPGHRAPSPRQVQRMEEMTEIVSEDGQEKQDLADAAVGGKDEKTHSEGVGASEGVGGDVNPYEGGDNLAGEEDEDMADVALSGRQPKLLPMDWEKVSEGQHYYDFACGSYGWMLYTFNHLSTSLITCSLCCRFSPLNTAEMEGSGCRPLPCCFPSYKACLLSVRAFELQSRVPSREILYCHLSRAPVYYVVVDRQKKALVISVRGTLSIADALIDLDAQLASLAPYGYPHGYTHQGILQNALHCRAHIDKKGVVAAFLRMNPNYSLVIVGHSLGAGTAAALTLIMRERFAQQEGVHAHTSHDALVGNGAQADARAHDLASPSKPGPSHALPSHAEQPHYKPRSLHCYIYGCPLLVDPITAQSPFAMSCITTFIYHDDMIARMSLASLFHLKQQMIEAYERSESRKWRIMRLAWGSKWEQLDKYDVKQVRRQRRHLLRRHRQQQQPSILNAAQQPHNLPPRPHNANTVDRTPPTTSSSSSTPPPFPDNHSSVELQIRVDGVDGPQCPSSDPLAPAPTSVKTVAGRTHPPSTQPIQVTTTAIEEKTFTNAAGERMTEVVEKKSTFSIQLRKMYLPGRIYLLLPVNRKKKGKLEEAQDEGKGARGVEEELEDDGNADDAGCCVGRKKRWVVFPAAQESFGEVIVDGHMFNDHVPVLSAWQGLNLPRRYREIPQSRGKEE